LLPQRIETLSEEVEETLELLADSADYFADMVGLAKLGY
jgi:hypothetical protein